MHTRYSTDLSQHPHRFYIPVQVIDLNGLSINKEQEKLRSSSILIIVWGGSGYIELNENQYRVVSGNVLICPDIFKLRLLSQLDLHGVLIEYSSVVPSSPDFNPLDSSTPLQSCTPQVLALASELLKIWINPEESKPFAVQHLFTEVLTQIYNHSADLIKTPRDWIDRVLQYIDTHYNKDLTRGQLAELANVSPEHFSRAFRKATGQTYNTYVTLLRIRKAQLRILTGASNLTDLAHEVGYEEGTYLSRKFKQVVGLSPTAYHSKDKKIVALNYNHTASLRALDITPHLGVYSAWLETSETIPATQKLSVEGGRSSSIYNSLASIRPDVIISYPLLEDNKKLLPLAPVIELPFMQMSWREQFNLIAEIVDRRQRAEEWLKHYDELCYESNIQLNHFIGKRGTAIVWEIGSGYAYCFSSSYGRGCQFLYSDLGFHPPTSVIEQGIIRSGYIESTIDDIASYPADHIFITGLPSYPEGKRRLAQLFHSERWLNLEAVRNNRVYILNHPDMFYGFDPISTQAQLHVLLRALTS